MLDVPKLTDPADTASATYLASALRALAREEQVGRRPCRLLEPELATWRRFRGRMGARDLAELLLEDAAITHPEPFDVTRVLGRELPLRGVPEATVEQWIGELSALTPAASVMEEVEDQAQRLGFTARPAFSDLHKLQPHHRVLELPGSGGRLAAHVAQTQPGVSIKDAFTIACASWQERMLAGLVGVAFGVVGDLRISLDPDLVRTRKSEGGFTHVFGMRPEKGGRFASDVLTSWFHGAVIVLV